MRHEQLYFLFSDVTRIKGIGTQVARNLQRLLPAATEPGSLPKVRDLLFHLPIGIVDRRFTCPLHEASEGRVATFVVRVDEHIPPPMKRGGGKPYRVICSNDTGEITVVFFSARTEYVKQALPEGSQRVISGRVEHYNYVAQMPHPDVIAPVEKLAEVQRIEPVYPLTVGLTSRRIYNLVQDAIAKLPELPEWIEDKKEWPAWKQALQLAHQPQSEEDLQITSLSRQRLAYDELLANQLHLALLRRNMQKQAGRKISGSGKLTEQLPKQLPFTLTKGQLAAIEEISQDMASGHRMTRLLQGDVGSGKTVVALMAMLKTVEEGAQAALMVPTEIVAQQHFEVISELLAGIVKPSPLEGEGGAPSAPGEGYNSNTLDNAKKLRKDLTDVEKKLWTALRSRQLEKYKFRRQQPIGSYIADFFCAESGLIIELDGGQHADNVSYDNKRTEFLKSHGYHVLRFWNHDVLQNIDGVAITILETLKNTPHPNPSPSRGEGLSGLPQEEGELNVVLLTGSVKGKAREEALRKIKNGEANIIIGTHALFQEKVEFHDLALAVIDEQHRFGVNQRMALSGKGEHPHLLHLTATPIPRSLTLTMYGDMDCSLLKEKPAERQPITTRLIPVSRYKEIMERLQAALDRGEKAYWVCPMIDEKTSEGEFTLTPEEDVAAAELRFTEFKKRFGNRVGLVHGRMKAAERHKAMQDFTEGKTRLLVATTVVEVGVDVRDATIIVIEKAERFGLSQLHQLRGRVGRGNKPSACVLLHSDNAGDIGKKRLSVLRESEDGFHIAEMDLALRGGGDVVGVRQSGLPKYIFADLFEHHTLLEQARDDVTRYLTVDPLLEKPRGQALRILLQLFAHEYKEEMLNAKSA